MLDNPKANRDILDIIKDDHIKFKDIMEFLANIFVVTIWYD